MDLLQELGGYATSIERLSMLKLLRTEIAYTDSNTEYCKRDLEKAIRAYENEHSIFYPKQRVVFTDPDASDDLLTIHERDGDYYVYFQNGIQNECYKTYIRLATKEELNQNKRIK